MTSQGSDSPFERSQDLNAQKVEHRVTETKVDDNKSQRHQISMAEVSLWGLITDALSHPPSPPHLHVI